VQTFPSRLRLRQSAGHLMRKVAISRDFRYLWLSQAISSLGDTTFDATILIWISLLTKSPTDVGGVLIAVALGTFLVGPVAGVYVDRWNRKYVMIATDVARFALILSLLAVRSTAQLPLVYVVAFLTSAAGRFFMPAQRAAIAMIVPADEQGQANALTQSAISAMTIIGPALGTGLFLAAKQGPAIIIDACSFLISALCVSLIQTSVRPDTGAETNQRSAVSVWRGMLEGLQVIRTSRQLRSVIGAMMLVAMGGGALNALEVFFVVRNLHQTSAYIGPIISCNAVGIIIGTIGLGIVTRRFSLATAFAGGLLVFGAFIIVYSQLTFYPPALAVTAIMGICNGVVFVAAQTLMMGAADQRYLGRVFATYGTCAYGASVISIAISTPLARFLSISVLFACVGILVLIGSGIAWYGGARHAGAKVVREHVASGTD
jgi:MFS family permease